MKTRHLRGSTFRSQSNYYWNILIRKENNPSWIRLLSKIWLLWLLLLVVKITVMMDIHGMELTYIYWGNLRLFKVWLGFSVNKMLGKNCIMRQEIMTWLRADERNDMRDCDLFILKGCCCTTHGCLKPEPYFKYNSTALCIYKSLMNTCDMTFDLRRPWSFLIRVTAPGILPTHLII